MGERPGGWRQAAPGGEGAGSRRWRRPDAPRWVLGGLHAWVLREGSATRGEARVRVGVSARRGGAVPSPPGSAGPGGSRESRCWRRPARTAQGAAQSHPRVFPAPRVSSPGSSPAGRARLPRVVPKQKHGRTSHRLALYAALVKTPGDPRSLEDRQGCRLGERAGGSAARERRPRLIKGELGVTAG